MVFDVNLYRNATDKITLAFFSKIKIIYKKLNIKRYSLHLMDRI